VDRWSFTATASSIKGQGTRSKAAGRGRAQRNSAVRRRRPCDATPLGPDHRLGAVSPSWTGPAATPRWASGSPSMWSTSVSH